MNNCSMRTNSDSAGTVVVGNMVDDIAVHAFWRHCFVHPIAASSSKVGAVAPAQITVTVAVVAAVAAVAGIAPHAQHDALRVPSRDP